VHPYNMRRLEEYFTATGRDYGGVLIRGRGQAAGEGRAQAGRKRVTTLPHARSWRIEKRRAAAPCQQRLTSCQE
jgi:hypothetical protein